MREVLADIFIGGGDEIHDDTSEEEVMDDDMDDSSVEEEEEEEVENVEVEEPEPNTNNQLPEQNLATNAVQNIKTPRSEEGRILWEDDDTAFVSINYLGIDPATGLIEVFVHIQKRENFILYRTDTIGTLKQMIFERKGIPVDIQRLIFTGKVLKDETTLIENRIWCGSNIHLFIRIRGGITKNCKDKNEHNVPINMTTI